MDGESNFNILPTRDQQVSQKQSHCPSGHLQNLPCRHQILFRHHCQLAVPETPALTYKYNGFQNLVDTCISQLLQAGWLGQPWPELQYPNRQSPATQRSTEVL